MAHLCIYIQKIKTLNQILRGLNYCADYSINSCQKDLRFSSLKVTPSPNMQSLTYVQLALGHVELLDTLYAVWDG